MKYYGLIPAKGRSRGLPGKNIAPLMGKPLFVWSIVAALSAPSLSDVFVSTESDQIAEIAHKFAAKVIVRPDELCGDETTSHAVIKHAIPHIRQVAGANDFGVVLLQPTSPLRTSDDIEKAIELFMGSRSHALVSVYPVDSSLLKVYRIDEHGDLVGAFSLDAPYSPRQSLPKIYMPNGAIYIFTAAQFLAGDRIPRTKVIPFIMDANRSIDIDTREDFDLARKYMEATCEKKT